MLSAVLRSDEAIQVSVNIMNTFMKMRCFLSENSHYGDGMICNGYFYAQKEEVRTMKIKKVEAGKKVAKKTAKKVAKDTAKTVAKETAKETAETTAKVAAKTTTKSAVAPNFYHHLNWKILYRQSQVLMCRNLTRM